MSGLRRFFIQENLQIGKQTILEGEEFLHAVNVLRVKEKDRVIIINNTEKEFTAEIISIAKKYLTLEIIEENFCNLESKNKIKLICGYLKGDKTELVIQKAVELGVYEIVVFDSQFSSSYISENKLERLNKVSKEACKQCGRSITPKVCYAKDLKSALICGEDYTNKLFACEFALSSDVVLKDVKGNTAIVIGSEGGFSLEEFELAKSLNYKAISLGKRILRADTACISTVAILTFLNGDLSI